MSDPNILPELPPFERLAAAAEKFAEIADRAEKNLGAIVSQLDEIRREVTKMADSGGKP